MIEYGPAEDEALIAAIAQRDEAAIGVIYDRYHRQCFAFSRRLLGGDGAAEEAVQEVFLRVWRNASTYDPAKAGVGSWILAITRNLCTDELRRRQRRVAASPAPEGLPERPSEDRTDNEAERKIMAAEVRSALDSLPEDQKSAIELTYFQGLSSREAAGVLGVPAPTVRSRLRLGLLKLGAVLTARGVIGD